MIDCYIINLDRSQDRWEKIGQSPGFARLNVIRVAAVDGQKLSPPYPDFSPWGYFFCQGRKILPATVACNLSHVKALRQFLDSGKEHAVICEDDVSAVAELPEILEQVLKYADSLDFVRLCGFRQKSYIPFAELGSGYRLISDLRCSTSNGAYLVNRKAAQILISKLIPMRLNADIAIYYSVPSKIREATVMPFPIPLNDMKDFSTIGTLPKYPLFHPAIFRYVFLTPYRYFTRAWRHLHRLRVGVMRKWFPPKPRDSTPSS